MQTYSVEIKVPESKRWERFTGVVSDGIEANFQFITFEDKSYMRFPLTLMVKFSPERYVAVLESMEREAGQKIPTR